MAVSSPHAKFAVMLMFLTLVLTVSCKPETPPARAPQAGAQVSPVNTPLPVIAIRPTSVSPLPTPLPRVITPPAPQPTPGPVVGPRSVYDPLNRFSITLLPGWYAYTPDAKAIAGVTTISNYDMNLVDNRPPSGLSIQISIGQLSADQTFEQWLSYWRALETSPENGSFGVTLTEPESLMLGRYKGVRFVGKSLNSGDTLEIDLVTNDNRVAVIGVSPADSPLLSEVLSMLSTIEISPKSLP
jgi:hypothetical protein